jgi:HEPN domain-containing protein
MNPLTLEWIEKAEGDILTARREYRVRISPNYDAVCFHAQQSAEKNLKAILQEWGSPIPRIHSLADLLAMITKQDPTIFSIQADANILEGYAVQFRYPGMSANKSDGKAALSSAENIRIFIRAKLGI